MFKTGAYGRADSGSSRPRNPPTLSKNTTKNTPSSKPKAKFGAKKPKASKKPSKAEMDRRKKDGACFYCGEQGHMANDCPKKEIKTNKVTTMDGDSEEEDSEDDEQDEDSEDEEVYVGYIAYTGRTSTPPTTAKTSLSSDSLGTPPQALEAYIDINGNRARVLFDTGTVGISLVSNRFVTTHQIPYEPLEKPQTLKMAVKGSRSTVKHQCRAKVEISRHTFL